MRTDELDADLRTDDLDVELITRLRERSMRVTSQRLVIHRVLRERATHMSAEQVHRECARSLPGVSLPTVYSALELLTELGLARRIDAGTGMVLFDGRLDPHHHAVCRSCGSVRDLSARLDTRTLTTQAHEFGFHVDSVQALAAGLCVDCAGDARRVGS